MRDLGLDALIVVGGNGVSGQSFVDNAEFREYVWETFEADALEKDEIANQADQTDEQKRDDACQHADDSSQHGQQHAGNQPPPGGRRPPGRCYRQVDIPQGQRRGRAHARTLRGTENSGSHSSPEPSHGSAAARTPQDGSFASASSSGAP